MLFKYNILALSSEFTKDGPKKLQLQLIQEHLESANTMKHKMWSGIQIQISRLIRSRMSARLVPKCFVGLNHFAKYREHSRVIAREILLNLLKSPIPQQ